MLPLYPELKYCSLKKFFFINIVCIFGESHKYYNLKANVSKLFVFFLLEAWLTESVGIKSCRRKRHEKETYILAFCNIYQASKLSSTKCYYKTALFSMCAAKGCE